MLLSYKTFPDISFSEEHARAHKAEFLKNILSTEYPLLTPPLLSLEDKKSYMESIFSGSAHFPLMNGGMGIDFSNEVLASAVIRAGGIGVMAGSLVGYNDIVDQKLEDMSLEDRKALIEKADKKALLTKMEFARENVPFGILGINLMKAVDNYETLVNVIGESKLADVLFVGAGLPTDLPVEMLKYPHMRYVPIISSDRAANIILKRALLRSGRKPDAWYLELPQYAGGHLGASDAADASDLQKFEPCSLLTRIRQLDQSIPIILAGGIMFHNDIKDALNAGFNGVSLGTRMLLTRESGLHNELIKEFYLNEQYPIVMKMTSPANLPSRYIDNGFLDKAAAFASATRKRCVSCIGIKNCGFMNKRTPYCIAHWLSKTRRGDSDGLLFTGSGLEKLRNDPFYARDGEIYIPTVSEVFTHVLCGTAAQPISS